VGQFFFFLPNPGLRQVALAYLLSYAMPWSVSAAVAVFTRLLVMIFELLWAVLWLSIEKISFKPVKQKI
jgi:hypothetical protein